MHKLALLFLLLPFVAVWTYGCDQTENPVVPQAAQAAIVETAPSFAAAGGNLKTGIVGVEVVVAQQLNIPASSFALLEAQCPDGKYAIAGGWRAGPLQNDYNVMSNHPTSSPGHGGWSVFIKTTAGSTPWLGEAWAVCVNAVP